MIEPSRKEDPMYARVAAFEGRDMNLAEQLSEKVRDRARHEDAIPGAHGFLMLIDREQGTALGITLFATEEEIRAAEPAFEKMASTIPEEMRGRRVSVDIYEVLMLDGGTGAKAARLSTLEGPPDQIDPGTRRVIEDILPRVQSIDGFAGVISLADRKSGTTKLITLWTSADALTASESAASNLRSEAAKAAGGTIAGVERYEVAVAERLAKVEATI
jgi:heme-degrading monooxygenase HmoA